MYIMLRVYHAVGGASLTARTLRGVKSKLVAGQVEAGLNACSTGY